MVIYKVTGSPVLVRQIASSDGRVVNVLSPGKLIYAMAEESGWIRTSGGNYIFKTKDIEIDNDISHYNALNNKITLKRAVLRSSSYADEDNPYADDDDKNIPTNPESAEYAEYKSTGTVDATPANTDTGKQAESNAEDENKGKEIKAIGGDVIIEGSDEYGNPVKYKASELGMDKDMNGSIFLSGPDPKTGTVSFQKDGKTYSMNASLSKLGTATSAGAASGITYNEFEQRELAEAQAQANAILAELGMLRDSNGYKQALNVQDKDIRHIFGMPYQFLPTTDARPSTNMDQANDIKLFGRKYKEKIASRAPILVMQPGEAIFLRGYSKEVKGAVQQAFVGISGDKELDKVFQGTGGEYYSFRLVKEEYYRTVNSACRAVAVFLGLDKEVVPSINDISQKYGADGTATGEVFKSASGGELGSFNWAFNSAFSLASYYAGAVQFYINSEAQVQENIGTDTRQSQLAGQINGISDKAMEAMFVMGGLQSSFFDLTGSSTDTKAATGHLSGNDSSIGSGKGLFNSIVGNISSLLAGGRMYFPEIWADSHFGRSYNVTIKLDSPDCDPLSIYLNVLVPLIHIMGFCLPRCAGDNTYISPFLVRAFYKSMFHIDMGMVTSCDIVKGDQGCWTQDGLPTQITVQLSIKDMYSVMTQSMGKGTNTILSNPAQMDYLANMCGINIAPANIGRTLELWWMLKGPNRLFDQVVSVPSQMITNFYATLVDFATPSRWTMNRER